jgi:pimeloyl-ACP methyl ester carboxylesterase
MWLKRSWAARSCSRLRAAVLAPEPLHVEKPAAGELDRRAAAREPIVLVAHSYGGAVSSEAANQVSNVKALVYLDALALEAGESNFDVAERFPSQIVPALQPRPVSPGRRQ